MQIDRLQEYFTTACLLILGVLTAIYCGHLAGGGNTSNLIMVLGVIIVIMICLWMGKRIWMLIPLTWLLVGQCYLIPVPFSVREVTTVLVFGVILMLKALKIIRSKPIYGMIDFILGCNLCYLLSVYIRNPVGVEFLHSGLIGGRPWLSVIIAVLAYWTLSIMEPTPDQLQKIPLFILGGSLVNGVLSAITYIFPFTAPVLSHIYSGVSLETYNAENAENAHDIPEEDMAVGGRMSFLAPLGGYIVQTLVSYFPPLTLLNPLYVTRFLLFFLSCYAITTSGHRSAVMVAFAFFVISSFIRRGWAGLSIILSIFIPLILVVLIGQGTLFNLPDPIQRSLTFLPGRWKPDIVRQAQSSTEWRVEMWKIAMTNKKYLKNKVLGDGFGFDQKEFEAMHARGASGQENMLIIGGFHSGPFTTIRVVGYVGGMLFYTLMIYVAFEAWKLIQRTRDTPIFPLAMFMGIPLIFKPVAFTFIFGAFENDMPEIIFSVGMLKMLSRSIDAYQNELQKNSSQDVIPTHASA